MLAGAMVSRMLAGLISKAVEMLAGVRRCLILCFLPLIACAGRPPYNFDLSRIEEAWLRAELERLERSDRQVRCDAALTLGQRRDRRAVPYLVQVLADREADVRAAAANALGWLGDGSAVGPLIPLLWDSHQFVVEEAALALGRLGEPQAAPALLDLLARGKDQGRAAAARALASLGQNSATPALVNCLERDRNSLVRRECARALRSISAGDAEAARSLEKALLHDSSAQVRRAAAASLGALGSAESLPALEAALKDKDPYVRQISLEAIRAIKKNRSQELE